MDGKAAQSTVSGILDVAKKLGLKFEDCRAISFDNASVMVGAKTGVQKRLCELNEKLVFINCDNHSLNLAGVHAVECDTSSVTFFDKLKALFEFFSRNTQRWNALKTLTAVLSVKGSTDSRWSSRAEAVRAVVLELDAIFATSEELSTSTDFTADTRSKAETLLNVMLTFEFLAYWHFWNAVLRKINVVQVRLQSSSITFTEAHDELTNLQLWIEKKSADIPMDAISSSQELCDLWGIEIIEERVRRKKRMTGEKALDEPLTREDVKKKLLEALETLKEEIALRSERLKEINNRFGIFLRPSELTKVSQEEVLRKRPST